MGRQDTAVFSNGSLVPAPELTKKYYWRIDEVNQTTVTLIKGRVWSFTVPNYIVVDDMDSYGLGVNVIYDTWLQVSPTHASINLEMNPPYVHDGNSMEFDYDNAGKSAPQNKWRGSWTEADATSPPIPTSDWTTGNVKSLSLYFYGDSGNSATVNDKMYIALDDGTNPIAVSIYPDINDIKKAEWQEWYIDLEDFNSQNVDLTSISKVHIGFGHQDRTAQSADGGTGRVYFDDIRLYLTRCIPDNAYPFGDLTGDCFIDGFDVEAMSADWLDKDYEISATEPCDANLNGWWKFDEGDGNTVEDSSAYTNTGTTLGAFPLWVAGSPNDPCDSAMEFDGSANYKVFCAEKTGSGPGTYPAELMPDTFTIACWTKLDSFGYYSGFVSNGIDETCGFYLGNNQGDTVDEGTFAMAMMTSSWQDIVPPDTYVINTWYHLAVTYDGNYANFYVDGILKEGPQDVGGPMNWGASAEYPDQFVIGSWIDVGNWDEQIDGVIDEVRFYNYALQAGEVAYLAGANAYVPLDNLANYVPRVPDPAVDPQYYSSNPDIVNFKDYCIVADNWLDEVLFP